jgi:uncharacterized protein (TIGR03083 family)
VELWTAPPLDARPLFRDERHDLLTLLASLTAPAWLAATAAEGWTVKDIALHLLDGDLGRLSRGRDGDCTGVLDVNDAEALVGALAAKNQRWLEATRQLSPGVVQELLRFSTHQVDAWTADGDLLGEAHVSWASDDTVPTWLDYAREFTETWVHHQQVRQAIGRQTLATRLPDVLSIFIWAFPYQYRVPASQGTIVNIDMVGVGQWHLRSLGSSRWSLELGSGPEQTAAVRFTADAAWRSLTGAEVPDNGVRAEGPDDLTRPLMHVRGIIA